MVTKLKKKSLSTLKTFPSEQVESVKILTTSLRKDPHYKTWRKNLINQIPNGYSWRKRPSLEEVLKILSEEGIASLVLKALKTGEDKKNLPMLLDIVDPKYFVKEWPPKNGKGKTDFRELKREINRYIDTLKATIEIPIFLHNPKILEELKSLLDSYKAFHAFIENPKLRKMLVGEFLKKKTPIYHKILNSEQSHSSEKSLFAPGSGEITKRIVQRLYPYLKGTLNIPDWIIYPDGTVDEEGKEIPSREKIPFIDHAISNLFEGKITPEKIRDLYDPREKINYGTY